MHWNLTAHKTLHIKTPEKWSFLWNEFVQIFETQIQYLAHYLPQTGFNFVGERNAFFQKPLHYENCLFSRPFSFPNELLCTKGIIVTSAYVLFIQASYIHMRRQENKQQNRCDIKYFT